MTVSKSQLKATQKYHKKAYERITLRVKKGQKQVIKQHADKHNKSLNKFIVDAIYNEIKKDKE